MVCIVGTEFVREFVCVFCGWCGVAPMVAPKSCCPVFQLVLVVGVVGNVVVAILWEGSIFSSMR